MGTEKTPLQVTPSYSKTRAQNLLAVQTQLIEAGLVAQADQFLSEYQGLIASRPRRDLDEHPITIAARKVGATVHWVK